MLSIITKCDQAASMGEAISFLIRHQLPIGYITLGTKVPHDIKKVKPYHLVELALEILKSFDNETSDQSLSWKYAGVK